MSGTKGGYFCLAQGFFYIPGKMILQTKFYQVLIVRLYVGIVHRDTAAFIQEQLGQGQGRGIAGVLRVEAVGGAHEEYACAGSC